MSPSKAVVLTSGGLDSATCLAIATAAGYECYTLSFDYGQKHRAELQAAQQLSHHFGAREHQTVTLGIGQLGGSALTDTAINIPDATQQTTIPTTYVPARNTVFLAIALGWAEVLKAQDIFIGVSSVDYSGYPDCRPAFINAFQALADVATKTGIEGQPIRINTPLLYLTKAATIQQGIALGVDYSLTISCYRADAAGHACGTCDSCHLRRQGFLAAGIADPTIYIGSS